MQSEPFGSLFHLWQNNNEIIQYPLIAGENCPSRWPYVKKNTLFSIINLNPWPPPRSRDGVILKYPENHLQDMTLVIRQIFSLTLITGEFLMNFKHAIAAAVMAVAASSSFADVALPAATGFLSGSGTLEYSFNASGYDQALVGVMAANFFGGATGITSVKLDGTTPFTFANGGWSYNGAVTSTTHVVDVTYANAFGTMYGISGSLSNAPVTATSVSTLPSTGPIAAVPEPETYAMMLAGLGALGFVGRRRKAK
jgi:hypothetical protein